MTPRLPLGRSSSPDDDPTGVRALLSSLPEPGPMPPELVERITSSLVEEQRAHRSGEGDGDAARHDYLPEAEADVRPLVRRPRWRQVVGGATGAAAAVVVGFVAVNAYTQSGGGSASSASGGSVARSSIAGSAGSTGGPGSDSSGGRGTPHQQAEGLAGAGALGAVRIRQSGRNYTEDGFARQAAPLARAASSSGGTSSSRDDGQAAGGQADGGQAETGPADRGAGQANRAGKATTPAGLVDCLDGLGVRATAAHPAVADVARYAGGPALVVVVTSDGGPGGHDRAWAVGRDCSATDPHVLHGPVTLP